MSLAVVNAGGSATNIGANLLADINLTSAESTQIQQILSELQSGMISPVEARAQIAGIVTSAQQPAAAPIASGKAPSSTPAPTVEPLQSYYELPLPQESLKGASYNSVGAATQTVFTTFQNVNANA